MTIGLPFPKMRRMKAKWDEMRTVDEVIDSGVPAV
jgi:hypothetical protein